MVDEKLLERLRAIGVKSVSFTYTREVGGEIRCDGIGAVEFFEQPLGFPRLDADTLVPPPPEGEQPEPRVAKVAPALARLLQKGSVS